MVKIWEFIGTKPFMILALIILIWLFGGADFIFRNPIIVIFGILALIIYSLGGKK